MGQACSQVFAEFAEQQPRLDGKIVAITGCTSGTGLVAAKLSAEKGAQVIMLNRPSERAKVALESVQKAAPGAKVTAIDCDLSDFESVRKAAAEVKALVSRLHVLANNAGVAAEADVATKDGYDIQMQSNHLSHFLLTRELLPLLGEAESEDARIVIHSSVARCFVSTLEEKYLGKNGGDLGGDEWGDMFEGPRWVRYQQTKLANVVFASALHKKLNAAGSSIKVVSCAPGHTGTRMLHEHVYRNHPSLMFKASIPVFQICNEQSQEDGTVPLLTSMFSAGVQSGDFYAPRDAGECKGPAIKKELEPHCTSAEHEALLWRASSIAVGGGLDWPLVTSADTN